MGKLNTKLVFGIVLVLLIGLIIAADKQILEVDSQEKVDEHSTCKYVNLGSDSSYNDILIPAKTSTEWSNFRSNAPSEVTFGDSCCDSGCCGDGVTDVDEECDGGSTSCEQCCNEYNCDGHGNCVIMRQDCDSGYRYCQSDCTWGACDASPSCNDGCYYDSDCPGY